MRSIIAHVICTSTARRPEKSRFNLKQIQRAQTRSRYYLLILQFQPGGIKSQKSIGSKPNLSSRTRSTIERRSRNHRLESSMRKRLESELPNVAGTAKQFSRTISNNLGSNCLSYILHIPRDDRELNKHSK